MTKSLQINLAEQICAAHAEASALAEEAKGYASQAVAKAIECGRLLIQQKAAIDHGSWMDWTAANLPDISHTTLNKYVRLAKTLEALPAQEGAENPNCNHGFNLSDAASVRQAYIAAGILPTPAEKEEESSPDPQKPWAGFIRPFDKIRLWYNRRIAKDPLEKWSPDARRLLKNELQWFVQLYERL